MRGKIYFILIVLFLHLKCNAQSILDIDGNIYNTVAIGTQTWMQENLKVTRFNNGIEIPTTASAINNHTSAIYQWPYGGDTSNIDIYGLLYTWNVVNTAGNVCPVGWRVPDNQDWDTLRQFLGGESISGGKMKEPGTAHWLETDTTVNNSSGFTGLGSGFRGNPMGFKHLRESGGFWSATPFGDVGVFPRGYLYRLVAQNSSFLRSLAVANNGMAIRCIKEEVVSTANSTIQHEIRLWPNPAIDRIAISVKHIGNGNVIIYDMLGNALYKKRLKPTINEIDISYLPKGTYIIQVLAEKYMALSKFIKQ